MKYLCLLVMLVLVPLVSAIPEIPHQFYGSVYDDNGPIYSGIVTAKLCNVDFNIPIVNGYYGLSEPFLVSKDSSCSGITIEFYVGSDKIRDYTYVSGGYTSLNLHVPVVEQYNPPVDNPPQDNPPQDTGNSNGGDEGKERDLSHIRPPPDDISYSSNKDSVEQDSLQELQIGKSGSITGGVISDFVRSGVGIATISAFSVLSLLGIVFFFFRKAL